MAAAPAALEELVPLTATHLLQALVDAGLPQGVLNMVLGKGSEVGEVLTTHEGVDAITFTGSMAVTCICGNAMSFALQIAG